MTISLASWQSKPWLGVPLDASNPLAYGLQDYWPSNEGAGLSWNSVGPRNTTGTLSAATLWNRHIPGGCLLFSSASVTTAGSYYNWDSTQPFSVSLFMTPTSTSVSSVLLSTEDTTTLKGWSVTATSSGGVNLRLCADDGSANRIIVGAGLSVVVGRLNHFVWTYDGSGSSNGVKAYRDGVLYATTVVTNALAGSIVGSNPLKFGQRPDGTASWPGRLSDVGIWNRVLSADEAASLWGNPWRMFLPSPSYFFATSAGTDVTATVSPLAGSGTLLAPTVSGASGFTASALTAAATLPAPTVTGAANVSPSALTAPSTLLAPAVKYDWVQVASSLTSAATLPAPTVTGIANVSTAVSALTGSGTLLSPTVAYDWVQVASALTASATLLDPTVSAGGSISFSVGSLVGSATLLSPTIKYDWVQSASSLTSAATLLSPMVDVVANTTVMASPLTGAATLLDPTVQTGGNITVSASSLIGSGSLLSPTIKYGWTQSATPLIATATLRPVSVHASDETVDAIAWPDVLIGHAGLFSPTVTTQQITPDVTINAAPLVAIAGLGFPDVQPGRLYRDADILDAVAAALEATGEFDGIYRCSVTEVGGKRADNLRAVCVEPMTETESDLWDSFSTGPMEVVQAQCAITLIVRHQDAQERDRLIDRLKSVARNALNGRSLKGLTMPDFTRFASFQSQRPKPPERQVRGTFQYRYLVDTFTSYSAND